MNKAEFEKRFNEVNSKYADKKSATQKAAIEAKLNPVKTAVVPTATLQSGPVQMPASVQLKTQSKQPVIYPQKSDSATTVPLSPLDRYNKLEDEKSRVVKENRPNGLLEIDLLEKQQKSLAKEILNTPTETREIEGPKKTTDTSAYDLLQRGINSIYNAENKWIEDEKSRVVAENRPNGLLEIDLLEKQQKKLPKQQKKDEFNLSKALLDGYHESAMKNVHNREYSSLYDFDKAEKAVTETPEYIALEEAYRNNYAKVNPVGAVAKSVFNQYSPDAMLAIPYVMEQAITGQEADPNSNAFRGIRRGNQYREILTKSDNPVVSFAKGTGLSMLETAARLPLGGAGVTLAGIQAGGQGAYDASQRDANAWQSLASGITAGAAEAGAEYVSLGSLLDNIKIDPQKGFTLAKNVLKQMGVEGSEELTTDVINDIADTVIMGNKSNFMLGYNDYYNNAKEQGLSNDSSKDIAFSSAFKDLLKEGAIDFAGGAISGGVFAGVGNIPNIPYAIEANKLNKTEKVDNKATKSADNSVKTTDTSNNIEGQKSNINEPVKRQNSSLDDVFKSQFGANAKNLKNFASDYSEKSQRNFVTGYSRQMDSADYAATFNKIYNASRNSNDAKIDTSRISEYLGTLRPDMSNENLINTATRAWYAGQNDRMADINKTKPVLTRGTGKVEYEGTARLEKAQNEALQTISKAIKVDVVVTDKIDENGYFDRNSGKIYISSNSQQPLRAVFNHEITHAMQDYQPEAYRELKDYMSTAMNKHNATAWETAVNEIYTKYSEDNPDFTLEMAEDEVIAKTAESFIENPESFEQLAKTNRSLAKTFIQNFKTVLKRFINAFKTSKQSIDVMTLEQWKTAESKWLDILVQLSDFEATENYAANEQIDRLVEASGASYAEVEEYANYKYLKYLDNLTSDEVEESIKDFKNSADDEWLRFAREDLTEARSEEWNNSRSYSKKLGGYFPKIEVSTKDIEVFGIKDIRNLSEVQKKVYEELKDSFISNNDISKPITNLDTGMKIEIRKGGINETFGNKASYRDLPDNIKKVKLATMTNLAKMIKYGEVRAAEAKNYHNPKSTVTYAYLKAPIIVDGQNYYVEMDIRRSERGNRFYIHKIKSVETFRSQNNNSEIGLGISTDNNSLSQKSENVNSKKYSLKTAEEMQKDNQKLSEEVEYLKRQFKTTTRTIEHTMKDIRKSVSAILKEKSSTANKDNISERIYNLYKSINESSNGVNNTVLNSKAFKDAQNIAYDIINSARTVDENLELMKAEYKSALDELKNYTFKVSETDMNAEDFKDLKSAVFPYIKLSRTEGTGIDSVWSEIYENVGYLIGSDYADVETVVNQLEGVANLVSEYRRIKNNTINPYESGMSDMGFEDAVHYTTMELLEGYFIQPKTYADKNNERLSNLRKFYTVKLAEQKERLQASYASKEAKCKSNEQRSKYIKHITRVYNNLSQKLISNTDKKHIPEELKGSVSAMLKLIDPAPQARNSENPSAIITRFRKIAGQLNDLAEYNNWVVDEDLADNLNELEDIIVDENGEIRPIKSLSNDELEVVHQVVSAVNKAVTNRDTTFRAHKAQTISAAAKNLVKELGYKETEITKGNRLYELQKEFLGALNANVVFETRLGNTVAEFFTTIKDDFFGKVVPRLKYVQDYWSENLKDWSDREQHTAVVIQGHTMTKGQAMTIYMLSLREAAQKHLYQGGIVLTEDHIYDASGKHTLQESHNFKINKSFIEDVKNALTDKELRICGVIAKLMKICGEWGNEATLEMYGFKKFNEDNYFTMLVDMSRKGTKGGNIDFKENPHARLKNVGMTKALVKNANAPLIISDIVDVATQHAITMAHYSGLAPSLTDFERLYNAYAVEQLDKDTYQRKAVKEVIANTKGKNIQGYIMRWLDDINGSAAKVDRSRLENLFNNYKGAMVSMNAKVILLQATSVYRAVSQTEMKYIGKNGCVFLGAKTYKEMSTDMLEHSGRAQWKDMGFSQINMNKGITKTISGRDVNLSEKIQDWQTALPNLGDRVAWTALWYGARNKIADTYPDIEINSEQYYELVNKEFSKIIDRTQVMDSPFSKSQHLRSKNTLTKVLTMFSSEPSMMLNMLIRSYGEGKKEFLRTVGSITATVITAALCTGLIKLGRRPADDKDTPEELANVFITEVGKSIGGDVMGIATASPMAKLIAEAAEFGYNHITHKNALQSLGQSYFEPLEDFIKAAVEVIDINNKKSLANRLGRFGLATGTILGVGTANFFRDVPRAIGRTSVAVARQSGYDTFGIDYSTAKLYWNMKNKNGLQEFVKIAAKADLANSEYAEGIIQDIIDETGIKKDILDRKIKSAQNTIINDAAEQLYEKYKGEFLNSATMYRKKEKLYVKAVGYSFGKEGEEAEKYREQIAKTYNVTEKEIDEALKKLIQKALREDDVYED